MKPPVEGNFWRGAWFALVLSSLAWSIIIGIILALNT